MRDLKANALLCGNCVKLARRIPSEFVDTIIIDPPYELGFMGKDGRWPANVLLDVIAAEQLDKQSGKLISGARLGHNKTPRSTGWGMKGMPSEASTGGASRFFYTAKASRSERGADNKHPTVKPLALMRWLCMLTKTPTGGIVLDPFMGSGSTIIAAMQTGRQFIGFELEEDTFEHALKRIKKRKAKLPWNMRAKY